MIKIICLGKIKEKYLNNMIDDYLKRISKYHKIEIIELRDNNDLEEEKNSILKHIGNNDYIISLSIEGEQIDSVSLAQKIDQTLSRESSQCKSTTFSSYSAPMKDLDIEPYELDEKDLTLLNRYHNEAKGVHYIDYSERNIICSSKLTNNYNYNEEEELKKLLNKECFLYPKNNNNTMPEQIELPIELLILLDKLKNVKTLIFQIQNIDELFMKFAILVLINIKWLFLKGIEEVKFDLGNEEIQQGLVEKFNERTRELYHYYQKNRNLIYYNGSYSKTNYPGYYDYMNINYCLLGTIIENITNERFDLYMKKHVLEPLNITGGFNLDDMSQEVLDQIGTIYHKLKDGNKISRLLNGTISFKGRQSNALSFKELYLFE